MSSERRLPDGWAVRPWVDGLALVVPGRVAHLLTREEAAAVRDALTEALG